MSRHGSRFGERTDVQTDFRGGMNEHSSISSSQYRYAENISTREGPAITRPGIRRVLDYPLLSGMWFDVGQDETTGGGSSDFWFFNSPTGQGFKFLASGFSNIQAAIAVTFTDKVRRIVFVSGGVAYQIVGNEILAVGGTEINDSDDVTFVFGMNRLVMCRGVDLEILQWDGSDAGFASFDSPSTGDPVSNAKFGTYFLNQFWLVTGDDTVKTSAPLAYNRYDDTNWSWDVSSGDGRVLTELHPFREDLIIAVKEGSLHLIGGLAPSSSVLLEDSIRITLIDSGVGVESRRGTISVGEDVWFATRDGLKSLRRNEQNRVQSVDLPLSWKIPNLWGRINFEAADHIRISSFDNYILISAPFDNHVKANAILVYDLLADQGAGAFVSLWKSSVTKIREFFTFSDKLFFIDYKGRFFEMFQEDPWDHDYVSEVIDEYEASEIYDDGDFFSVSGLVYRATQYVRGEPAPNAMFYEVVADENEPVHIESLLVFRPFDWGNPAVQKFMGMGQVMFRQSSALVTLSDFSEGDPHDSSVIHSDVLYSRTAYDVGFKEDWDDTNVDADWADPHRGDYDLIVPALGFWINAAGEFFNQDETHGLRFIKRSVNLFSRSVKIENKTGRIAIDNVVITAKQEVLAKRSR